MNETFLPGLVDVQSVTLDDPSAFPPGAQVQTAEQPGWMAHKRPFAFEYGMDYADVLLPVSPFSETSGTFVNCEGRAQSFNGTVKPLLRPSWFAADPAITASTWSSSS